MPNKPFLSVRGHGQHATKVRFTADDRHLISLDGYSGCVFTYRVLPQGVVNKAATETLDAHATPESKKE
jgi:hypothetical protein